MGLFGKKKTSNCCGTGAFVKVEEPKNTKTPKNISTQQAK